MSESYVAGSIAKGLRGGGDANSASGVKKVRVKRGKSKSPNKNEREPASKLGEPFKVDEDLLQGQEAADQSLAEEDDQIEADDNQVITMKWRDDLNERFLKPCFCCHLL